MDSRLRRAVRRPLDAFSPCTRPPGRLSRRQHTPGRSASRRSPPLSRAKEAPVIFALPPPLACWEPSRWVVPRGRGTGAASRWRLKRSNWNFPDGAFQTRHPGRPRLIDIALRRLVNRQARRGFKRPTHQPPRVAHPYPFCRLPAACFRSCARTQLTALQTWRLVCRAQGTTLSVDVPVDADAD